MARWAAGWTMETCMTKFSILGSILGGATALAAMLASPAMAQEVIYNPGYCAQFYPNANCQNKGPGNPYTGDYQRRLSYQFNGWNNGWNNGWQNSWNDDRFARPRSNFAYDPNAYGRETGYAHSDYYANAHAGQGWNGIYDNRANNSYAALNGFVCSPGSYFRGEDGRRHRCQ
jgi:hypothetical protein